MSNQAPIVLAPRPVRSLPPHPSTRYVIHPVPWPVLIPASNEALDELRAILAPGPRWAFLGASPAAPPTTPPLTPRQRPPSRACTPATPSSAPSTHAPPPPCPSRPPPPTSSQTPPPPPSTYIPTTVSPLVYISPLSCPRRHGGRTPRPRPPHAPRPLRVHLVPCLRSHRYLSYLSRVARPRAPVICPRTRAGSIVHQTDANWRASGSLRREAPVLPAFPRATNNKRTHRSTEMLFNVAYCCRNSSSCLWPASPRRLACTYVRM